MEFSELFDQLVAYESSPNTVHYVTRFMERLQPTVRLAIGIQQPTELDTAYQLALLHEELGMHSSSSSVVSSSRRASTLPLPPPQAPAPSPLSGRVTKDRRISEGVRRQGTDKWGALRAYRRA